MNRRARSLPGHRFSISTIDPERRNAILLVAGISVVVLLALGLVAYGYYTERVQPKHAAVVKVGSREFDYSYIERRAIAENLQGNLDTSPNQVGQSIVNLLQKVQNEELTRQAAKSLGVSASQDEINARMRTTMGVPPQANAETFASRLRSELVSLNLSLAEFEDIARAQVLDKKLRDQFRADIPAETQHVDLRLLKFDTQANAIEAKNRIAKGESIAKVAADSSTDPSKNTAGELGLVPRGALPPELEDWAFNNSGVSDIIETEDAFYILESRGVQTQPVNDDGKDMIVKYRMDTLLAKTKKEKGATSAITNIQAQKLAKALGVAGA